MACERYNAIPIVAPMFKPKERDMIKYSPPPSTLLLVAISEIANAVGMVTACPRNIIRTTPQKPRVPTAYPKRRNKVAPKIVDMAVKKTGAVPKFFFGSMSVQMLRFIPNEPPGNSCFSPFELYDYLVIMSFII